MLKYWRHWLAKLGFKRLLRPEDIPHLLDADTLGQAMKEAQFLRGAHRVDVKAPSPGELPIPRRAENDDH